MKSIYALLFVAFASWANFAMAQAYHFRTFTGVVKNELLGLDQLIKLELIPVREGGGDLRIRAVMTLQFGGFESSEYVSYHFHNVQYNLLTGVLTFNQTDQEVYLSSAEIKNNVLKATLYSSTGIVGPVELSSTNSPRPMRALIAPVGGEYRGSCGKIPASLQLYTYRSTKDTFRPGNPFKAYEIKGQLGQFNRMYCSSDLREHCVYSKITSGSYDFNVGKVSLIGYPFSYVCDVTAQGLNCGECTFKRSSNEMRSPQLKTVTYAQDPISKITRKLSSNPTAAIAGTYSGYVFQENINIYQKIQIDVSTFQRTVENSSRLFLAAVARVYFGDSPAEAISYRYDPIEFPNPLTRRQFTLAQPDADVDAMIHIEDIRDGIVTGAWYSLVYGKVGSFVATLNGDLPALSSNEVLGSVTGVYDERRDANGYFVDTLVGKDTAPVGSDNPFYPLALHGNIWRRDGIVRKQTITGGSYDFYTGHVTFVFGESAISGTLVPGRQALFRRLGGGFGTLMQRFETVQYDKQK